MMMTTTVVHSWAKSQKPAKNKIWKNHEINGSYLCLQRSDKFWMWISGTRKRKLCEFAETSMEKLVKSPWVYLCMFWWIFDIWNHCVAESPPKSGAPDDWRASKDLICSAHSSSELAWPGIAQPGMGAARSGYSPTVYPTWFWRKNSRNKNF